MDFTEEWEKIESEGLNEAVYSYLILKELVRIRVLIDNLD